MIANQSPCDCPDPCGCFVEGYAQGLNKAHFETRNVLASSHSIDCACEPCKTARVNFHAGYEAGRAAAYEEVLELLAMLKEPDGVQLRDVRR